MIPNKRASILSVSLGSLILAAALSAIGCAGASDPLAEKARTACLGAMAQDAQFAQYGLTLAARSEAPFAKDLLLDALASGDLQSAMLATKALADDPAPETADKLREVFSTSQGSLRLTAGTALAKQGDAEAVEWLKGQLETVGGAAQQAVAVCLAERGETDLVRDVIQRKMMSEERLPRDEAYAILGEIKQPWATQLLLAGLEREFGEDRRQAIVALGRTGDPAVAPAIAKFANTRGLVFETLEALGALGNPDVKRTLEKMLKNDDSRARTYAGTALWRLGLLDDPEARLGPLVADESAATREALAEQLANVDQELALSFLLALAEDEEPRVRAAAVRALAKRADPATTSNLLQRIGDPDYSVSTVALDALARVGQPAHLDQLAPLLEDENPYVVISAAQAILAIKSRQPVSG